MKTIKLILLCTALSIGLTSCGMNNNEPARTETPMHTQDTNNVSDTNNGRVEEDIRDAGDSAGNAVDNIGDAAGDVVDGVGNAAGDVVEGVGDAVGTNDANNNGR